MRAWLRLVAVSALACGALDLQAAEGDVQADVARLVEQLDRGSPSDRSAAEQALVERALAQPGAGEEVLALLPTPDDRMSQEVATRLVRIRAETLRRLAERNVRQTKVTLDVSDAPLADVLAEIEKQTGNRVIDHRGEFSDQVAEKKVTLQVTDVPFWEALDRTLDAANMAPYPYEADGALGLVERPPGVLSRAGRGAVYAGPFRIEATSTRARRGARSPDDSGLDMELEIAWEPRLRPVGLTQAAEETSATSDDGLTVPAVGEGPLFTVEVSPDSQGAEVNVPLQLPAREAKRLSRFQGQLQALVPGRVVELRFSDLAAASDAVQDAGGVKVTLHRVVKNQAIWELQMRVRVDSADAASHGWVLQNTTYLENAQGERLEHGGFETTAQNNREIGLAYFFELPEGSQIDQWTWVYRTPAAIVNLPVDYELTDVLLP